MSERKVMPLPHDEPRHLVPGRLPNHPHGFLLHRRLKPLDEQMPVQVIDLMLQSLRHRPSPRELNRLPGQVDPDDPSERIPQPRKVEPRHRQASLVDQLRLPRDFDDLRVDHVADDVVDVEAECPQPDADLVRRETGASGLLDAVDEVFARGMLRAGRRRGSGRRQSAAQGRRTGGWDERSSVGGVLGAGVDVASDAGSGSGTSPSTTTAARSRAASRVCTLSAVYSITAPAARAGSYGQDHDIPHPGCEVCTDRVECANVGAECRGVDHDDGVADEVARSLWPRAR